MYEEKKIDLENNNVYNLLNILHIYTYDVIAVHEQIKNVNILK